MSTYFIEKSKFEPVQDLLTAAQIVLGSQLEYNTAELIQLTIVDPQLVAILDQVIGDRRVEKPVITAAAEPSEKCASPKAWTLLDGNHEPTVERYTRGELDELLAAHKLHAGSWVKHTRHGNYAIRVDSDGELVLEQVKS